MAVSDLILLSLLFQFTLEDARERLANLHGSPAGERRTVLGFDTAENEPTKIWWQTIMNFAKYFDFANFAKVGARGGAEPG